MFKFNKVCLPVLLLALGSPSVKADVCDSVNAVLVPSIRSEITSKQTKLAFLKILSKDDFEEIKKQRSGALDVPGYFSASGSYDDFNQKRNTLFQQENFTLDESQSKALLEIGLPPEAIQAWKEVSLACIVKGIKASVAYADANTVTVVFTWVPPAGAAPTGVVTSSSISGGKATLAGVPSGQALPVGTRFSASAMRSVDYKRQAGQPFNLSINVNSTTSSIHLNP